MMDFQTPPPPLSGIVRISDPPSPRTSAMPRKNSRNLVYVKSKKLFLLLELFYNYKCRVPNTSTSWEESNTSSFSVQPRKRR